MRAEPPDQAEMHVKHHPTLPVVEEMLAERFDIFEDSPVEARCPATESTLRRERVHRTAAERVAVASGDTVSRVSFGHRRKLLDTVPGSLRAATPQRLISRGRPCGRGTKAPVRARALPAAHGLPIRFHEPCRDHSDGDRHEHGDRGDEVAARCSDSSGHPRQRGSMAPYRSRAISVS